MSRLPGVDEKNKKSSRRRGIQEFIDPDSEYKFTEMSAKQPHKLKTQAKSTKKRANLLKK